MGSTARRRSLFLGVFAVAMALAVSGCSGARQPIIVGYIGGLSGRTADLGVAGRDGALLAVEDVNAAGGVDGHDVTLAVADDAQDATVAVAAFQELNDQGAIAVVGPMTSAMAVVLAPLADKARIPLVSPTTSTDELTGIADYFYRLYPDNSGAAVQLASAVKNTLGHDHVAMIYDLQNRAHTETWARNFTSSLSALGGSVVASQTITSGDLDSYGTAVEAALAARPDAVFVLANALDTARLATLIRQKGYAGHVITSEWSATEVVIGYGGRAVEGMIFLNTFDRSSTAARYVDFARRFKARFGYEAGFASVHAYDSTRLVLSQLGGDPTRAVLKRRLDALRAYEALQGPVTIDAYGDVKRDYFLMTIRDGAFVKLE